MSRAMLREARLEDEFVGLGTGPPAGLPASSPGPALLGGLLLAVGLALPGDATAQEPGPRIELGAAPLFAAGFEGDAWANVQSGVGVAGVAAVRLDGWRLGLVGTRSTHSTPRLLRPEMEMLTLSAEVRRTVAVSEDGLRFQVGARAGAIRQEFTGSGDPVEGPGAGIQVTEEDSGIIFGPVVGVGIPVAGPVGLDANVAYQWADVTPFLMSRAEPEPGYSRALQLEAAVTVGF